MTKVKELDFKGTTIFCGLDVHKVSWRVNIRDTELELKDFTQPADPNLPAQASHQKLSWSKVQSGVRSRLLRIRNPT